MKYVAVYSRCLKYGAAPEPAVESFLRAHHGGDRQALHSMADHLEDHDDPRAAVLGRSLGHTEHPGLGGNPVPVPDGSHPSHATVPLGERGGMTFQAHSTAPNGPPSAVYVGFHHSLPLPGEGRSTDVHHGKFFTPDEARGIADRLPPEHATAVHQVLDHHFGPRA